MFTCSMNSDEKSAFLGLADLFLKISDLSEERISKIFKSLRVHSDNAEPSVGRIDEMAATFTTTVSKRAALMELAKIARTDGAYNEDEREFLLNIADEMGIKADTLDEIMNWAERYILLLDESVALINA